MNGDARDGAPTEPSGRDLGPYALAPRRAGSHRTAPGRAGGAYPPMRPTRRHTPPVPAS